MALVAVLLAALSATLDTTTHADPRCDALAELAAADCYAKAGKLGTAWQRYHALAGPKAAAAAKHVAARAAKLTLEVSPEVEGLRVFANAVDASSALTTPMPVDAGELAIAATAPGYDTFRETVTTEDGATSRVTIKLVRKTTVAKLNPDDPDEPDPENAHRTTARAELATPPLTTQLRFSADVGFLFGPSSERVTARVDYTRGRLFELGVGVRARLDGDIATSTGHELGGLIDGRLFAPLGSFCRPYAHAGVGYWSTAGVDGLVGLGGACQDWARGTGYQVFLGADKEFGKLGGVGLVVGVGLTLTTHR